jgi:taurine dioxygenase
MAMTVERLADTFVARVGGVDLAKLDHPAWAGVHRAYLDHKVLLFHGQRFTPQELIAFSERFGPVEPHTVRMYRHAEAPGITILSNRVEMGRPKGIRDAGSHWHSDYSYRAIPANVTILYALEVPEEGGDTIVCDLQAAWESLPEDVKRRVDGRMQRIEYRWTRDREHPESRWKLLSEDERRETPEVIHPVVRTHPETGRKALFVFSGLTSGVKGIVDTDEAESDEAGEAEDNDGTADEDCCWRFLIHAAWCRGFDDACDDGADADQDAGNDADDERCDAESGVRVFHARMLQFRCGWIRSWEMSLFPIFPQNPVIQQGQRCIAAALSLMCVVL